MLCWRITNGGFSRRNANCRLRRMINLPLGPRGLLSNYPLDVVYLINGEPITRGDILQGKQSRQRRQLAAKRRNYEPIIKPCWIQVGWCPGFSGFAFRGWWLYVQTLHVSWAITRNRNEGFRLEIMRLFPCGYLPMIENFESWQEAFAGVYHRPTLKRPVTYGAVTAWAKVSASGRQLLDITLANELNHNGG